MEKINFINNSEPDISAENLNLMQTNIDNAKVEKTELLNFIDKGILPNGKSFNDVYAEGNSCVYAISGSYNQSTLPGFPTGAYNYGTLLTFNPRKVSSESDTWDLSQIYMPDQPANRGMYFRSRRTSNWLKIEGTAVAPIT